MPESESYPCRHCGNNCGAPGECLLPEKLGELERQIVHVHEENQKLRLENERLKKALENIAFSVVVRRDGHTGEGIEFLCRHGVRVDEWDQNFT